MPEGEVVSKPPREETDFDCRQVLSKMKLAPEGIGTHKHPGTTLDGDRLRLVMWPAGDHCVLYESPRVLQSACSNGRGSDWACGGSVAPEAAGR